MVNVGANKGYAIRDFAQLWAAQPISPAKWHRHIVAYAKRISSGHLRWNSCGSCGECRRGNGRSAASMPTCKGWHVHALELNWKSRELLRHLVNVTGLASHINVHDLAGSNQSMMLAVEGQMMAGFEALRAITQSNPRPEKLVTSIQATSIDAFLRSQGLFRNGIYQLTVDAEGWDALILDRRARIVRSASDA